MKQSLAYIRTIHEVPSNKPSGPNDLLIRAGYIHLKNDRFISLLPLGKRVLKKIEKIILDEMVSLSANEVSLPVLNSKQNLGASSLDEVEDAELLHWTNRKHEELYLATSYLEILTSLVKEKTTSFKQLPIVFYQIQTKFRDEINCSGMFKNQELLMLDVYSFHSTMESLDEFYEKMNQVYSNIFRRLGLSYKKVVAHLENNCDEVSHEFVVLSEKGDTTFVISTQSDFAVNINLAKIALRPETNHCEMKELLKQKIREVNFSSNEIFDIMDIPVETIIKSNTYIVNDELLVVLYRGDHTLNEVKLKNSLKVSNLKLADDEFIREIIGCSPHFVGPIKLPVNVKVIADYGIKTVCNGASFGNEDGYYYINVNPERDFAINAFEDLRYIQEDDLAIDGIGSIEFTKGFDIAHTFKLGSTYSKRWEATFVDENGDSKSLLMGAYEFGISRLFAVISELFQDEKGFIWPNALAPFDVHLLTDWVEDEEEMLISEQLYNILTTYQFEVLFDDRETSIDVKLEDANLIGIPVQVILGKKANEGIVKVHFRRTGESFECAKEELIDRLNEFFRVY